MPVRLKNLALCGRIASSETTQKPFSFEVITPDRTYVFSAGKSDSPEAAENEEMYKEWTEYLAEVVGEENVTRQPAKRKETLTQSDDQGITGPVKPSMLLRSQSMIEEAPKEEKDVAPAKEKSEGPQSIKLEQVDEAPAGARESRQIQRGEQTDDIFAELDVGVSHLLFHSRIYMLSVRFLTPRASL